MVLSSTKPVSFEEYDDEESDGYEKDDSEDEDFDPIREVKPEKFRTEKKEVGYTGNESDELDEISSENDDFLDSESDDGVAKKRRLTEKKNRIQKRAKVIDYSNENSDSASKEPPASENNISNESEDYQQTSRSNHRHTTSRHSREVRETRSSNRAIKKKSYAEEDSDDALDSSAAPAALAETNEETIESQADSIERVLWHQPEGTSAKLLAEDKSVDPIVMDCDPEVETDWMTQEFYIKWKGLSYRQCEWVPYHNLVNLPGFKKVQNYIKRADMEIKYRLGRSAEDLERMDLEREHELVILRQYKQVERVVSDRLAGNGDDEDSVEYFVKWIGLSYKDGTWENANDLTFAQDAIDEYTERQAGELIQGNSVESQRRNSKGMHMLEKQPDWLKGGTLRDYQLTGLNFLINSWLKNINVILADEMGLGKTIQSVSIIGFLHNVQKIEGPFLVVVPLSTLSNWAKEFKKWLPKLNVVAYIGDRESREIAQKHEFWTGKPKGRAHKFHVLLTTNEIVNKDKAVLSRFHWSYLMVDEAHRLKNSESNLYSVLMGFKFRNKLLITGTPLQNSVEELWALLHFLDARKFSSKDDFVSKYKNLLRLQSESEIASLHEELRPHILRRVIKDVEQSLPPKIERILRVELSPLQKQYYKWILERNFVSLNKGVQKKLVSLRNIVMELKKCCNHPFLFESADHGYGSEIDPQQKVDKLVLSSGKLALLDKLLKRLKETNHRVLIFSQMVCLLDILAEYLSLRGFQYQRLDGRTRADVRQQAMDHFNSPGSQDFCFLLSTKAGGLGINLATADTVIIFDSDWNPQNDLQAMSRAHRIGQKDVVNIYRFVTSGSVEEDILERAKQKMVLDHLVIQKLNAEGRIEKKQAKDAEIFDQNELASILRFGAEALFNEKASDEEGTKRLQAMDIDEILARAEKVETQGGPAEGANELLNAFTVANFSSTEDDATFWSRLIPNNNSNTPNEPKITLLRRRASSALLPTARRKHSAGHPVSEDESEDDEDFKPKSSAVSRDRKLLYVSDWFRGLRLIKRDASVFMKAVKRFGDKERLQEILAEAGGELENMDSETVESLFDSLVQSCQQAEQIAGEDEESKRALVDFFGVTVKATELSARVSELTNLKQRIQSFKSTGKDLKNFRLSSRLRAPGWAKACSWNLVDDARLILGVYYHGFGQWELIRRDERLGLKDKILPAGAGKNGKDQYQHLPKHSHIESRAASLLKKEFGSSLKSKPTAAAAAVKQEAQAVPSSSKHGKRSRERSKPAAGTTAEDRALRRRSREGLQAEGNQPKKRAVAAQEVQEKEEGEISEREDEEDMEWCRQQMQSQQKTLDSLRALQDVTGLPTEKILHKVKKYLRLIGGEIDSIMKDSALDEGHRGRLWKYTATYSHLPGQKLADIYRKLKQENGSVAEKKRGGAPEGSGEQPWQKRTKIEA